MDRRLFLSLAALAAVPAVAQASSKGGDAKTATNSTYLALGNLLGTTTRVDGRRGVLSVDVGLDVPDAALRKRAEQSVPRLRAAYVQIVQSYASGLTTGQLPSPDYIGQALQRQTDAILGKPGARVLLGAIIVN
ncbi:Tat pathway signal protein [Phenylobacterium kunshanense]|uniref:Tat pathway signal protein n=2 Tax=Phenylobacterium kunshanense TaxID=1445034 RepID=A0A328BN46_9CAUL|nr:Tat pathway signal protein [Phenylobacterium kunshanense]